ncbi:MAG: hypothetical protein ABFS14_12670 [Gemmatimonadota bacterium]
MLRRRHRIQITAAASLTMAAIMVQGCVPDAPDGFVGPGPTLFSINLVWDAPSQDAEGNPLTDLAGYRLYYSQQSPPTQANGAVLDVGLSAAATVDSLAAGMWFFAVAALDASGNESLPSAPVGAEVGTP